MPIEFTAGYIEVWLAGEVLSRHRTEREAVESILAHAETTDGEYEIRHPVVKVNVKRRIVGPDAPALGPVLTVSDTALTVTLDRAATGPTRIDRYELDRFGGVGWTAIASGIGIFGSNNRYPDTGLLPSTEYSYRCRAVDTTERGSEYSYVSGTTSAGAVNTAPVWTTGWSLTIQQGSNSSVSTRVSDPEGDAVTISRVGGTAPAGVTCSGSGVVSVAVGTTTGAYTLTLRASDGLLTADTTVDCTVSAASTGNEFIISSGTSTFNAATAGVQPGDTITIAYNAATSGVRGALKITNVSGTAVAPVTIRNDPDGAGAVVLRRASASAGGFIFEVDNVQHIVIDGSVRPGTTYGIKVTSTASGDGPSAFIQIRGRSNGVTVKYCEVDGRYPALTVDGVGMQVNDSRYLRSDYPGEFRDGFTIENNWIHDIEGEGLYIGPNFSANGLPLKNVVIRDNLLEDIGWEALQGKSWWEGTNQVYDNIVRRAGTRGSANQDSGLAILSGKADVFNNWVEDTNGNAFQNYVSSGPSASAAVTGYNGGSPYATFTVDSYNNVAVRCGGGINYGSGAGLAQYIPRIYNNTIVTISGTGIACNSEVDSSGFIRNNIVLSAGAAISDGPLTEADNLTVGNPATVFVSSATDNYHLASAQLAVNGAGTDISTTDIEGTTRVSPDKGAYEYI